MAAELPNRLIRALKLSIGLLDELGQSYALVGGLAISVRSEPRFTRDIDISVVAPDDAASEALTHALQQRGYTVLATVEQEAVGPLATVRLRVPLEPTGIVLDLLFASCGIEPEIVAASESIQVFPDMAVPVACVEHLIAMKVLSRDDRRRPQDRMDLRNLIQVATKPQLELAREALKLVQARGYNRGINLEVALQNALEELGS